MGNDFALLRRVDRYLDAAPDTSAVAVDVGPLRVFVSSAPWPYYVRPRPDLDLRAAGAVSADDVTRAAAVLEAAGQAVSFEWIAELVPSLEGALQRSGYAVRTHPLLARSLALTTADLQARLLDADSPEVVSALAVSEVAFAAPGTAVSVGGVEQRDAHSPDAALVTFVRNRIRGGHSVVAVLEDPRAGVIATGWHQPIGDTTEIVGVATLPTHRRRGAAASVVQALLSDAHQRGCTVAVLSADSDEVARIYERVGFVRIGSTGAAEPER